MITIVFRDSENKTKGIKAQFPEEMYISDAIKKVKEQTGVPKFSDTGEEIQYALFRKITGKMLKSSETIGQLKIDQNEIFLLKSKKQYLPLEKNEVKEYNQPAQKSKEEKNQDNSKLFCPMCRSEIVGNQVFCGKCGQRLIYDEAVMQNKIEVEVTNDENVQGTDYKSKTKRQAIVIGVLMGIIILLLLAMLIYFNKVKTVPFVSSPENKYSQNVTATQNHGENVTKTFDDKKEDTIEVTLDSLFFGEYSYASDELTDEQKEKGFLKAKVNGDGSVTYTIKKTAWEEMVKEMKIDLEKSIAEITSSDSLPEIKKIDYNNDFSKFKIAVDKSLYEKEFDHTFFMSLYIASGYYQKFTQNIPKCTFEIIDVNTHDVLDAIVYPDALEK